MAERGTTFALILPDDARASLSNVVAELITESVSLWSGVSERLPSGDVVLVTGASSGFGKLTVSVLAERGYVVFGTSRKAASESKEGFEMVQLDITSDQSARKCVSAILEKCGRIDVLVNNAGEAMTGGLEETSLEEAKAHFESTFFGAVRMVNAVLPEMRKRRNGRIINIASLAGIFPVPSKATTRPPRRRS